VKELFHYQPPYHYTHTNQKQPYRNPVDPMHHSQVDIFFLFSFENLNGIQVTDKSFEEHGRKEMNLTHSPIP